MRRRGRAPFGLLAIEPSTDGRLAYRPCRAVLHDGSVVEHVVAAEARPWLAHWGVEPEDDAAKALVLVEDVAKVLPAPDRLPASIATEVYRRGETRMGGTEFGLRLADGRVLACAMGNVVDFVAWPEGAGPEDIAELLPPGPGDLRCGSTDVVWCLYEP